MHVEVEHELSNGMEHLLWDGSWELNHSHNESHLYPTFFCFKQSFKEKIRFIPIIIFVKVCLKPWTAILAKGLYFSLHHVNATLNTLKINRILINRAFKMHFMVLPDKNNFNIAFKMEITWFHTSRCIILKMGPPKSIISTPFATTSTLFKTFSQPHQSHYTSKLKHKKNY